MMKFIDETDKSTIFVIFEVFELRFDMSIGWKNMISQSVFWELMFDSTFMSIFLLSRAIYDFTSFDTRRQFSLF